MVTWRQVVLAQPSPLISMSTDAVWLPTILATVSSLAHLITHPVGQSPALVANPCASSCQHLPSRVCERFFKVRPARGGATASKWCAWNKTTSYLLAADVSHLQTPSQWKGLTCTSPSQNSSLLERHLVLLTRSLAAGPDVPQKGCSWNF